MPSSATPSPLDQLAGIADVLNDCRFVTLSPERHAARLVKLDAAAATLATLREVLTEWRDAHAALEAVTDDELAAAELSRRDAAEIALYRWLTPDSPRQAGEEITDGKD